MLDVARRGADARSGADGKRDSDARRGSDAQIREHLKAVRAALAKGREDPEEERQRQDIVVRLDDLLSIEEAVIEKLDPSPPNA